MPLSVSQVQLPPERSRVSQMLLVPLPVSVQVRLQPERSRVSQLLRVLLLPVSEQQMLPVPVSEPQMLLVLPEPLQVLLSESWGLPA